MKYIILSEKKWNKNLINDLSTAVEADWILIKDRSEFSYSHLNELKPDKIFIPHWSYIIPSEIYENFECIVFHMTDLPYGRGGSPLQNLISRGHNETKISALRVNKGVDAGGIYLKKTLSLYGTAEEIFIRSNNKIEEMIIEIIHNNLFPIPQKGEVSTFKRRKPEDSDISKLHSIEAIYDFIRMLDCEGYPNAFIEVGEFRFEFTRASFKANHSIIADVRIIKK